MARDRGSSGWLAAAYAALVVYASLYPFGGWRLPSGPGWADLLVLPWPVWRDRFDEVANGLGYAPLGALVCIALLRRMPAPWAGLLAVAGAALLSYLMEVTQGLLPVRVPSLRDLAFNAAGAAGGAAVALALHAAGALRRWQALRDRWFLPERPAARVLMLLWPVGLLFPPPVPLGLGHVWDEVRRGVDLVLAGTPWSAWWAEVQAAALPAVAVTPTREGVITTLGVLAPCLVAYAAAPAGWRRLVLAAGAVLLGVAATTVSTALNFGPQHAWSWPTAVTPIALAVGAGLAAAAAWLPARLAAACGLVVLTAMVALVADAPADPYHAASLQAWEQGRFIRFHGVAQWVGWLWPYAAMAWLLGRVAAPDRAR